MGGSGGALNTGRLLFLSCAPRTTAIFTSQPAASRSSTTESQRQTETHFCVKVDPADTLAARRWLRRCVAPPPMGNDTRSVFMVIHFVLRNRPRLVAVRSP